MHITDREKQYKESNFMTEAMVLFAPHNRC